MRLVKWDPINEFVSLQNELNKAFGTNLVNSENHVTWNPSVDLSETKEAYKIKADLPGIDKENIEILFEDKTLTIKGERKTTETEEGESFYKKEINYGSFQKRVFLSQDVDSENIKATYNNGVLELNIPKAEKAKTKKIVLE